MTGKITFRLVSNERVDVLVDGVVVGNFFSDTPYHVGSVQVCGFSKQSAVWSCASYEGTLDTCLTFSKCKHEYCKRIVDCWKCDSCGMLLIMSKK